jgi:hypothetical protein
MIFAGNSESMFVLVVIEDRLFSIALSTEHTMNRYSLKIKPTEILAKVDDTLEDDYEIDDSSVGSDSSTGSDDEHHDETEYIEYLVQFSRKLAVYTSRALNGAEKSRRKLRALVASATGFDEPLAPFTSEVKDAIRQVAELARAAANGDEVALQFVVDFIKTDVAEDSIPAETPATSNTYACIHCGETVMQMRNPLKPCGRTKYFMDFKQRCSSCR